MRSRNVVSHTSYGHNHDIDLKNISSSDVEAIKSKGFEDDDDDELKKTNIIVMIKNPRIILCLGILLGVVLSIFIHHIDAKPIQNVHKNVKYVYRAHNEARKEYLKRYREAYLESILSSSANVASKEELNIDVDEIISTAAADIEVENTITVEKEVNSSIASTSDKIIFKTLENGKHVCLPLIPEEFSELVVEEGNDASGALTSRAECEWFNTLTKVGLEAAKMPSTCVPNNHIFATFTNDHDWEMLEFGLQYVKSEKCLIDRLLVLCLDDESFIKCKAAKFEHCVEYIISLGASDFLKDDYKQIVWLKPKMALALLNAKLSLFTLDSDILFFQVPDLAKIVELNPDVELFYQWERVDYKQVYTIPNYNEDYEENIVHDGFNSGQVLWLPTENVIKGILFALLDGKRGAGGGFEQTYSAVGMKKAGVKSAGLSFKYAGNWACKTKSECLVKTNSQNWISYHATWVIGLEEKMEVLKMAKEGWLSLTTKASDIGDKLGVNDNFKGEGGAVAALREEGGELSDMAVSMEKETKYGSFIDESLLPMVDFYRNRYYYENITVDRQTRWSNLLEVIRMVNNLIQPFHDHYQWKFFIKRGKEYRCSSGVQKNHDAKGHITLIRETFETFADDETNFDGVFLFHLKDGGWYTQEETYDKNVPNLTFPLFAWSRNDAEKGRRRQRELLMPPYARHMEVVDEYCESLKEMTKDKWMQRNHNKVVGRFRERCVDEAPRVLQNGENVHKCEREFFSHLSEKHSDIMDVFPIEDNAGWHVPVQAEINASQFDLGFAYEMSTDGYGGDGGLYRKLASNTLIFFTKPNFKQLLDDELVPWRHYVPLWDESSEDVLTNFRMIKQNPDLAWQIARNGHQLVCSRLGRKTRGLWFKEMFRFIHSILGDVPKWEDIESVTGPLHDCFS